MRDEAVPARKYAGRRVLVTGATGFIGAWLVRALGDSGAQLWLHGRDSDKLAQVARRHCVSAESLVADLAVAGAGAKLVHDARPDIIFNLVAYGVEPSSQDESLAHALNVELVEEMAAALATQPTYGWLGARMVHTGSAAEYGIVPGVLTEQSPATPTTLYGRTKLEGSRRLAVVAGESDLRAVTVRLFTVYGPGERRGRLLPSLLAAATSDGRLRLTPGTQKRDFTYVADVAEGLVRLGGCSSALPPAVNLATGVLTSVREFTEIAAQVIGLNPELLQFGAMPQREDEVAQGPADNSLLRSLVNWAPTCIIREGVRRTFELDVGRRDDSNAADRT